MQAIKRSFPVRLMSAYGSSHAANYASSLALNAFMAMFPMILGILSLVGLIVHDNGLRATMFGTIESIFPAEARQQVGQALNGVQQHAGVLGIISLVGLIWSGTSLFASMEFALTQIHGGKQRDTLRQRAMGFVMMVVFLVAVLVAVAGNSATAAGAAGGVAGTIAGAIALVLLLTAIYRWVPNRTFSLKQVLPGAILAGVLTEVFTLLFPLYAKVMHGFNTYGQEFALFFLIATWLIFLSQFILLGAVFNRLRVGPPKDEGLVASKDAESKDDVRPVDAIEEKREQGEQESEVRGERTPAGTRASSNS